MKQRAILLNTGDIIKLTEAGYTRINNNLKSNNQRPLISINAREVDTKDESFIALKSIAMLIGDLDEYFPDQVEDIKVCDQFFKPEIEKLSSQKKEKLELTTIDDPEADRKEKVKEIFGKDISKVSKADLFEKLGIEDEGQKKDELIDLL